MADYERRFASLAHLYDNLLADFIVNSQDNTKARKTAEEFFGTGTVRFAAVDGTMYSRPLFDMVIFLVGLMHQQAR